MKYLPRLNALKKKISRKNLTYSLEPYPLDPIKKSEVISHATTDLIIWYFSSAPPLPYTQSDRSCD